MSTSKNSLPQMDGGLFLTDGGIETTLIYHDGFDLPYFAAFDLLKDEAGTRALRRYFARHASIAQEERHGLRPGKRDLARQQGLGRQSSAIRLAQLEEANRKAIELLRDIQAEYETPQLAGW